MAYYKFEQLKVWKLSRSFVRVVYIIAKDFPDDEKFGLTSQIRRAVLSIVLNIAEGCDRGSDKEFIRFLRISYTSLLEVVTCCYIARDQGYMSKERFSFLYNQSHLLGKKINALIRSLSS